MSLHFRHLVLATGATLALGAGVGAAPALASPDLLTLSIRNVQPVTDFAVHAAHGAAQEGALARKLDANALSCAEAVKLVAPLHATSHEVTPKREWLTGERAATIADRQYAAGLREEANGHHATGVAQLATASATFTRSNLDLAKADRFFGAR